MKAFLTALMILMISQSVFANDCDEVMRLGLKIPADSMVRILVSNHGDRTSQTAIADGYLDQMIGELSVQDIVKISDALKGNVSSTATPLRYFEHHMKTLSPSDAYTVLGHTAPFYTRDRAIEKYMELHLATMTSLEAAKLARLASMQQYRVEIALKFMVLKAQSLTPEQARQLATVATRNGGGGHLLIAVYLEAHAAELTPEQAILLCDTDRRLLLGFALNQSGRYSQDDLTFLRNQLKSMGTTDFELRDLTAKLF
jgi:hypothetical protein